MDLIRSFTAHHGDRAQTQAKGYSRELLLLQASLPEASPLSLVEPHALRGAHLRLTLHM